jgi:CDP-glycerol glycerophosphotransferase (TagB/SpsB family)
MTSDILISDFSSMMVEYFATGKPIIYTHRTNLFNEYGIMLSEGLYWVQNIRELDETISMLLSGKDPLRKRREELMNVLFFMPEGGAGRLIKEHVQTDYKNF